MHTAALKKIPSVQEILSNPSVEKAEIGFEFLKGLVQRTLDEHRQKILDGKIKEDIQREALTVGIVAEVQNNIERYFEPRLKRVINATGIILHTNLGRAPLAEAARSRLPEIAENYCNLEINLSSGKRGDRLEIVEELLCLLTGAEAAVVVNNNAAAVLLALNSLCRRKEVPVSRGEQVEIGGSFRMPEVMKLSRAKMVEIGTTNKTTLRDYENAITQRTAALLKVHTSNYKVLGFTSSADLTGLAELAHRHNLPLIYDMGSGVIEDIEQWGYPHEPVAREVVGLGVDVTAFSADKILGGPQAGIIVGKERYLRRIKKNHLMRALRCDKLTYALLEATLKIYLNPGEIPHQLPVANMLNLTTQELRTRANELTEQIRELPLLIEISDSSAQMGSGALPLHKIPSVNVRIRPQKMSVSRFASKLRSGKPPVVAYIEEDYLNINLRTVRRDELELVAAVIKDIFSNSVD